MRLKWNMVLAGATSLLVLGAAALAETKVELKGVHLCCNACEKGVATALKGQDGVKAVCDRDTRTVAITAADDATAQKALDALTDAGYFGTVESQTLVIRPVSNLPAGKVKSLGLNNTHNCCGACGKAIKKAVASVAGVSGDTVQPRTANFEVSGDFEAAAVVKALNDAGFQVKVRP
jgi:mercuric ion binding protein